MPPRLPSNRFADRLARDMKPLLKLKIGKSFGSKFFSFGQSFYRELCRPLLFALGLATSAKFISHIIGDRSEFQVVRVYARRIVTFVTNNHAIRNWAFVDHIGDAVSEVQTTVMPNLTMPRVSLCSVPNPTRIRLLNLCPELFFKGLAVLKATFATAKVFAAGSNLILFAGKFTTAFSTDKGDASDFALSSAGVRAKCLRSLSGCKRGTAKPAGNGRWHTSILPQAVYL